MTNQNPPPPPTGMERAIEAALPIIRESRCGMQGPWCGPELICYCRVVTCEIIAAADRARGRPSGKDVADRIVRTLREHDWSVGMDGPDSLSTELRQLIIAAWAEMPALPARGETVCKESLRTDEPHTLARTATDGERASGPAPFSTEVAKALDFLSDYILGGEGVHDDLSEARAAFRLVDNHVRGKFIAPPTSTREHPWWMLRMLVDKAWQKATESSEVPSTKMSDTIIEIIFGPYVAPAISPSTHETPGAAVLAGGESDEWIGVKWLLGGTFRDFDEWLATRPDLTHAGTAVQLDEYNIWVTNRKSTQPHTLEDRITALEQGGADRSDGLLAHAKHLVALEKRPVWTAEKESLLRMLGEILAGHLFWRESAADRSNSHKLIKLKNAAFPEPQS